MARGAPAIRPALPDGLVLLGEFGRAHGLKGEVRLKSHTGDPLAIGTYGPLTGADGRTVVLGPLRRAPGEAPDMLVARVDGVADRDGAEALNRLGLYCPRERLGEAAADEDEYFLADLIGLDAAAEDGTPIGPIVAVPNFGGGDLLEIAPPEGPTLLVPFTKAFVPAIDLPGRRVTVAADALVAEAEGEADGPDAEPA